jgi:hypothetical protein
MAFALTALVAAIGVGILVAVAVQLPLVDGILIGAWMFISAFGFAQTIAPGRMIEWRTRMMAGGPTDLERVGHTFSNVFGIGASADSRSKRNMRLVGLVGWVAGTAVLALMWWAFHRAFQT